VRLQAREQRFARAFIKQSEHESANTSVANVLTHRCQALEDAVNRRCKALDDGLHSRCRALEQAIHAVRSDMTTLVGSLCEHGSRANVGAQQQRYEDEAIGANGMSGQQNGVHRPAASGCATAAPIVVDANSHMNGGSGLPEPTSGAAAAATHRRSGQPSLEGSASDIEASLLARVMTLISQRSTSTSVPRPFTVMGCRSQPV
jgi:hypothetical protein